MELTETIEAINGQLVENFGIDTITGLPIWRIVWSEDQFEKRFGTYDDYTKNGLYIRTVTEVREVPKYRQWIHEKYVLERLVIVPEENQDELPTAKLSYENLWTFEDVNGNYLPPKWEAAKFIIDTVYAAQYSNHNLHKYVDDESSQEKSLELKAKRVTEIEEALWGDQSELHGRTADGTMVAPSNRDFEIKN
jgi:hypothetical protein